MGSRSLCVIAIATFLLAGCSIAPSDKVLNALAKDQATLCFRVHAVYGIGNGDAWLYRTNAPNATVKCNADGMTVTTPSPP